MVGVYCIVLQLVTNYACPRDLLYVIRKEWTATSRYVQCVQCYDETALRDGPLWTVRLDDLRAPVYDDPYVVAPIRPAWQNGCHNGMAGNVLYIIGSQEPTFHRVHVRTRGVTALPKLPADGVHVPGVAADADWVWLCGGARHAAPFQKLTAFDARVGRWHIGQLPWPLFSHTMTSIAHLGPIQPGQPSSPGSPPNGHVLPVPSTWCLYDASDGYDPALLASTYARDGAGFYDAAILAGGVISRWPNRVGDPTRRCWLMRWNPAKCCATWRQLPPLLEERSGHGAVVLDGRLIVLGGSARDAESLDLSSIDLGWTQLKIHRCGAWAGGVSPVIANGRLLFADGTPCEGEAYGVPRDGDGVAAEGAPLSLPVAYGDGVLSEGAPASLPVWGAVELDNTRGTCEATRIQSIVSIPSD